MRRELPLVLFVLAILVLSVTAVGQGAQQGQGQGQGAGRFSAATNQADRDEQQFNSIAEEKRQQGFQRAQGQGLFAKFNQTGNQITGRYVSFNYTTDGQIRDYRVSTANGNVTLIQNVQIQNLGTIPQNQGQGQGQGGQGVRLTGAVWRLRTNDVMVSIHNNPVGLFHITGSANYTGTVTFTLPQGATAEWADGAQTQNGQTGQQGQNATLRVSVNGTELFLVPSGNATLQQENGQVRAQFQHDGGLLVQTRAQTGVFSHGIEDINKVVSRGKAGAMLTVVRAQNEALQAGQSFGATAAVENLMPRGVTVRVASENASGKVIILNLDPALLDNVTDANRLRVRIDNEQVQVQQAMQGMADAFLNATTAMARVNHADANGVQVWVYVPHFSERQVTIESTEETTNNNNNTNNQTGGGGNDRTPGFGAVVVLAAAALGVLLLRRRIA